MISFPEQDVVKISTTICQDCQQLYIQLDSTQELQQNTVLSLNLPSSCPVTSSHCKRHFSHALEQYCCPYCPDYIIEKIIIPLVNHMNKGRIRRIEIAQIMEECQLLASNFPTFQFKYLPRECNCWADYFAGFASAFTIPASWSLVAPFSYSLLHKHGFKVAILTRVLDGVKAASRCTEGSPSLTWFLPYGVMKIVLPVHAPAVCFFKGLHSISSAFELSPCKKLPSSSTANHADDAVSVESNGWLQCCLRSQATASVRTWWLVHLHDTLRDLSYPMMVV